MANAAETIYQLAYEISPIILFNGIASSVPGSLLPIVAITEAANFGTSILTGQNPLDLNKFFAHFRPLPGTTLVDNDIATYPFANQSYAANAIIAKPLRIPMLMSTPSNNTAGFITKMITFTALKYALDKHNQLGGTYIIATPSYVYLNCVMERLTDISRPDSNQAQNTWQFDFIQPLLSENQGNTLSALMSQIELGLPSSGAITGGSSVLNNPNSVASPMVNGASNLQGTASSYGSTSSSIFGVSL